MRRLQCHQRQAMLYSIELDISVITVTNGIILSLSGVCIHLSFLMTIGYIYIRYIPSTHEMITITIKDSRSRTKHFCDEYHNSII